VVLSASYPARAFGVRSAMPVMRARRLCPQAVFVPPRHQAYATTSKEVMAIFGTVTPEVEPLALDEAFLDVSGALRRLGPPAAIAAGIRVQVQQQQGITCSVGVAPTKFVAKIASARCKPDGLLVVPQGGVLDFLHPLPVAALWGVGDRAGEVLARLGLRTVGDIARTPLDTLQRELGAAHGAHLAALAWGRDERRVTPHAREKSIGAEETFATDIAEPDRIRRELLRLSGRTAQGLRAAGYVARTVSVKLRLASFKTLTRSRTLPYPTDVAREIYTTACSLYESSGLDRGAQLRLVGVRVSGLVPAADANTQLTFDDRPVGWREAEQALDQIARRFGASAVRPAALVEDPGPRDRPGREAFLPATGSALPSGVSTLVFWKKNRVCEVKVTAHVPGAWFLGGVVPLSEHEQRQLEQIEQALYREDPKFGRVVRSSDPRVHYKRKLVQAVIGILVGAGALAAGVVTHRVWLDGAGAAVVLLSLLWAIISWRRHVARVRPARTKVSKPRAVVSGRSRAGWRARLMERMEERWRRRQEGDRRM
jgi:DNA polymerase IV